MPIKLSVAIITFNEERNIERCIKSVKGLADEIVVLDSFSTDGTEEICKKYGVKFYKQVFEGYIEQKNKVLEFCNYDWVLSLDADEALSEKLFNEIKRVKENPDADGYYFNRLTFYVNKWIKHSGWYPDRKLRLWKKELGRWEGTNPHDFLVLKKGSKIKHLKGDLLHYSYYSVTQHIDQINKFTTIGAKEAFKKGKKSSLVMLPLRTVFRFVRDYFIKLGFLDGYYGFVVCSMNAWSTFNKYVKLRELQKGNDIS